MTTGAPKEMWISRATLASVTDWARRTIQEKVRRGEISARQTGKRLRNGKIESEYLFSSLPEFAQVRFQNQICANVTLANPENKIRALAAPPCAPRERGDVPGKFRERVNKWLPSMRRLSECSTSAEFAAALVAEKNALGVKDVETVRRWFKRFRNRGEAGLTPNIRRDEKESRLLNKLPWAAAFILSKAVGSEDAGTLSDKAIWRELRNECEKRGELDALPSLGTVARYLKNKIRPDIRLLAREGKREYQLKAMPRIVRDTSRMFANDWWIMDHRVHDVFTYNTIFPGNILPQLKMYRLWMSLTWDWGSRKVVGVIWAPTPSSRTITASLRMAVAEAGLPRNFYWDNGEDYKKVGRVLSDDLAGILKTNGVEITNALPYNPMSKAIEPFFQTIGVAVDQKAGVAYCGNDPKKCSGRCREAQHQHKAFLDGKVPTTPLKSDRDFIIAAAQEIDEYNARGLDDLGGRSPNEVFEQQAPRESRRMVDRRTLDQLFYERDTRVVKQGGCVELNNLRYEPTEESFGTLSAKWKSEVTIARDAWDLGTAIAFDPTSGAFIGELRIQQTVEQTPHGRLSIDGIRATARRKTALYRSAALYLAGVDAMAAANGFKSAFDSLLERAGAQATGTDGRAMLPHAPGAAAFEPKRMARELPASPFVSDAVQELLDISENE